jgi:hypothetical protein
MLKANENLVCFQRGVEVQDEISCLLDKDSNMTKYEYREKLRYFGLVYSGYWDGKHWAIKPDVDKYGYKKGVEHGGTVYVITNEFSAIFSPETGS